MTREDYLVFGAPQITDADVDEVVDCLRSRWLGTGPRVARFEEDFAAYKRVDSTRVAALNSCTAALHVSMIAAGLAPGDEVITTALTFCATVNAIIHSGATPVLADIDPGTMNIDPSSIENAITDKTRAIVPVHFAGRPCDMTAICDIANRYNLRIIEDCAHAIESEYHGSKIGTFGDFGCFSFYVTKNVATGEGGMVVAKDVDAIQRIKVLSLHGMSKDAWHRFSDTGYKHYLVTEAGFKYNMMDIQAALGIHQLSRIEENWARRQQIWSRYQAAFEALPLVLPAAPEPGTRHAYHLYTILIESQDFGMSRDDFVAAMHNHNIGTGVHYLSIAEHPYYQQTFGWHPGDYPNAASIGRRTASLPLSPALSDDDVTDVIEAVLDVYSRGF